ncbi:LytR C-terminal domain-containing protein [Candidatus Nomurabacteria bacterium]|nr:LytR C-terminal domain-containing protein [Candidatus Nomurabacteria bacterium]
MSPTIFDMSANPSQEWTSFVRVINPNPYEIKVYANVVNFAPQGESGQGKFIPIVDEEAEGQTIAEWIDITKDEITIPPEETLEIPFSVLVPENAPPGGHFAALLIGTKPPEKSVQNKVVTSQIVTTLMFLRVTGDITESGNIRSFRTTKSVLEQPQATFELRFENSGNVHVLPQGEIVIKNMWGQDRGSIPINRTSLYGNVLPQSVRNYSFTWTGEWSLSDIGRYTAVATLAYGQDGRKSASSEISFWVIPWKILLTVFFVISLLIYLFTLGIKIYIRRMFMVAGLSPTISNSKGGLPVKSLRRVSVVAPLEEGMLDLRERWGSNEGIGNKVSVLLNFLSSYRVFFSFLLLALIFILILTLYVRSATVSDRAFNIKMEGLGDAVNISSEELKYQEIIEEKGEDLSTNIDNSLPKIAIVNRSGVSGLGANLRVFLESASYDVVGIENEFNSSEKNTVIVYRSDLVDFALQLSEKMQGALLSSFDGQDNIETPITIYVGQDLKNVVQ